MIPGLQGVGFWWCGACPHVTSPVVGRSEYHTLPFSTGIEKIPVGATIRHPISREDFDWQVDRLHRGGGHPARTKSHMN